MKKCAFLQCSSLREKRILIVEYPVLEAPIGVRQMQQSKIFWSRDTVRGSLIGRMLRARTESGGIIMTVGSLTPLQGATPLKECLSINDVRILVAKQLGVDIASVTNETHFTDDLGADFLDRVELMIAIEDQFAGVEITDDDVEQIQIVGDLIRHLQNSKQVRS